ncbi:MAG: SPOR domain-containing protein [Bacteroidia bacterium]
MDISQHISDLLFDHDCVVVPTLGGFVSNYSHAVVHPILHTFEPPSKKIVFNKNLQNNDGLLADSICRVEKINFQEASKIIFSFVENCKKEIAQGNRVTIEKVGILFSDIEGNLQFEHDKNTNYSTDSFGLTTFYSPAILRENYQQKIEKKFKDRAPIENRPKKNQLKRYVVIAIVVPVLALLIWLPLKTNFFQDTNYASLNPFSKKITAEYVPSKNNFSANIQKNNSANTFITTPNNNGVSTLHLTNNNSESILVRIKSSGKTTDFSTSTIQKNYHVIGGCFTYLENAQRLVKKLQSENISAEIIGKNEQGLNVVSLGNYATQQEAENALPNFRSQNPGAWVLKK